MKSFIVKRRILILLFAVIFLAEGFGMNPQSMGGEYAASYEHIHSHEDSFNEPLVLSEEIIPGRTDNMNIENLRLASSVAKT